MELRDGDDPWNFYHKMTPSYPPKCGVSFLLSSYQHHNRASREFQLFLLIGYLLSLRLILVGDLLRLAVRFSKHSIYLFPDSFQTPETDIMVYRAPWWKVMGHHTPLAT
jgi:hypothetical protein